MTEELRRKHGESTLQFAKEVRAFKLHDSWPPRPVTTIGDAAYLSKIRPRVAPHVPKLYENFERRSRCGLVNPWGTENGVSVPSASIAEK